MENELQTKTTAGQTAAHTKVGPFFLPLRPKLSINQPNDVYEQEADAVADKVVRAGEENISGNSFFLPVAAVQRKCKHCDEEEKRLQKKGTSSQSSAVLSSTESYISNLSGGKALTHRERNFFEPRMGYDFSNVRIHTDSSASRSAGEINALAYTHGNNIVFAQNQYQPESADGTRLMAHELTHVVQQGNSVPKKIQRAVGSVGNCTANANGAPAVPRDALKTANDRAVLMSLGAAEVLTFEALTMQDPALGPSTIFVAYHRRFGDPSQVHGAHGAMRFRNRFSGTLHNTLLQAQASEMMSLSDRLGRISRLLARNLHFKCADHGSVHLGDCTPTHCGPGDVLASCPTSNHGFDIAVCSGFWGYNPDLQAVGQIHEASHMLFHFGDHDAAPFANTSARRIAEPECIASMVADIYNAAPFDPSCPVI